jgi:transposase
MAYSIDFREKVILIYEKKRSLRKTAELLEVSYNFVKDIVKRWKTEGTLEPRLGHMEVEIYLKLKTFMCFFSRK